MELYADKIMLYSEHCQNLHIDISDEWGILAVWFSGNTLASVYTFALCYAWIVLECVTICRWTQHLRYV